MKITDLEKEFFTIDQLKKVAIRDNGEPHVDLKNVDPTIILETRKDNIPYTGDTIFVRKSVAKKLQTVQKNLSDLNYELKITDGYRALEVQEGYWKWRLEKDRQEHPELSGESLENYSIRFTAKPEFSYHPTGGAVDLTIISLESGDELDMGTLIDQFSELAYSHYPHLSDKALSNRQLLFKQMESQEFYNFPSEWWHFSYGTIDWALHYKKPHAIYKPIRFHI